MGEITEIIKDLNWPKQVLDKSEAMLKTLFGPSFDELGGMLADQIKLRRFKNQLNIFTRAQEILKEKNINPQKVSLKVLAPLIELSSYEEDETLQEKWANLTSHILSNSADTIFQQNCINILSKISNEDAILLDKLSALLERKKISKRKQDLDFSEKHPQLFEVKSLPRNYRLHTYVFRLRDVVDNLKILTEDLEFQLANLIALGLLKWETEIEVKAEKSDEDPGSVDIDVDVDVSTNDIFIFTTLGAKFIDVCKKDTKIN